MRASREILTSTNSGRALSQTREREPIIPAERNRSRTRDRLSQHSGDKLEDEMTGRLVSKTSDDKCETTLANNITNNKVNSDQDSLAKYMTPHRLPFITLDSLSSNRQVRDQLVDRKSPQTERQSIAKLSVNHNIIPSPNVYRKQKTYPSKLKTPELYPSKKKTPESFPSKLKTPELYPSKQKTPESYQSMRNTPESYPTKQKTPELFHYKEKSPEPYHSVQKPAESYHIVRNFALQGRKVINLGDSLQQNKRFPKPKTKTLNL